MSKRINIGKKARFEIFERDGFQCAYCGKQPPGVCLEVDHVEPVSKGGTNDPGNLITSCFNCNRGKGAKRIKNPEEHAIGSMRRLQEALEASTLAKVVNKAVKDREAIRQNIANVVCDITGYDSCKKSTITGVLNQVEHFGIVKTLELLDYAGQRVAKNHGSCDERAMIKYFHAVCRNKKEEAA